MFKKTVMLSALFLSFLHAEAADLRCYSNVKCDVSFLSDANENFHKLFPSSKWEVIIMSGGQFLQGRPAQGQPSVSLAYATAWLSPINSRKVTNAARFAASGNILHADHSDQYGNEVKRIRQAVSYLIEECQQNPSYCAEK